MAAISKNLPKFSIACCMDTLNLENFDEIALSLIVKEIEAFLCFRIFGKNSKWPPFLKNFRKVSIALSLDTLGVENFDEIALSLMVKEIEAILCFATFGKNSKWRPFRKICQNSA